MLTAAIPECIEELVDSYYDDLSACERVILQELIGLGYLDLAENCIGKYVVKGNQTA